MVHETLTLVLTGPVQHEGKKYDRIDLREPELRHVLVAEKQLEAGMTPAKLRARDIALIALVSGVPERVVRDVPVSIQARAIAFLNGFISRDTPPEDEANDGDLLLHLQTPLKDQNGAEYLALMITEPTTGAVEAAERVFEKLGVNTLTIRQYQQILIGRAGDLPETLVPMLPITVVDRAARRIARFTVAGPSTGA